MDTAVSGEDRAKAFTSFGPVHGFAFDGFQDGASRIELIMRSGSGPKARHSVFLAANGKAGDQLGRRNSGFSRERRSVHPAARANSSKNAMS
jgi:hypothetical protein